MKINSLSELGEVIKHAKQVDYRHKVSTHQPKLIPGLRNKQLVIYARFDKNNQLCDIQPRFVPEVQSLFDKYKGRPHDLIADEIREIFADMIANEIV